MSTPTLRPVGDAPQLTEAESALLAFYRAMSDDGRWRLVSLANKMAERFPRQVPARLSLVRGAA